jgi:proteasome lid subunit RPN8/RPN11
MNHIIPVNYSQQSMVYLRVEDDSNINKLAQLDSWGVPLVAHFHSHPGNGPEAIYPSGIDRRFQDRLASGGHVAIGAIYSQDGYIRFFAGDDSRFQISIFGNHVKEISKNVYKIDVDSEDLPIA